LDYIIDIKNRHLDPVKQAPKHQLLVFKSPKFIIWKAFYWIKHASIALQAKKLKMCY
jgi:hypothetical protein